MTYLQHIHLSIIYNDNLFLYFEVYLYVVAVVSFAVWTNLDTKALRVNSVWRSKIVYN